MVFNLTNATTWMDESTCRSGIVVPVGGRLSDIDIYGFIKKIECVLIIFISMFQ